MSGGERKRVNIGMELTAQPSVLFLDEVKRRQFKIANVKKPTSGLDATTTKEIIGCLQKIAKAGVNVIVVLHQPRYEVFRMFDDIMLLSAGKTVYFGPSDGVVPYFEKLGHPVPKDTNPADALIDAISGEDRGSYLFSIRIFIVI